MLITGKIENLSLDSGPTGLVATMGAIHEGHLSLVSMAQSLNLKVVVSLFVNRLQFGPNEDFDKYPRCPDQDYEKLEKAGVDLVFAPDDSEMFPVPQKFLISPPSELANILEGVTRPSFFVGVTTIVMKLLQTIRPTYAFFGQKDYQQYLILSEMIRQFNIKTQIMMPKTVRNPDGLALSSRNIRLSKSEQKEAPQLYKTLAELENYITHHLPQKRHTQSIKDLVHQKIHEVSETLTKRGWDVDYICVRRQDNLQELSEIDLTHQPEEKVIILGAAKLGMTRLIDNVIPNPSIPPNTLIGK